MPTLTEILRRALVSALVAVWLACGIVVFAATGEYGTPLAWGGFTIVGAVILNARPGNWIGRIMLVIGLYWPASILILLPGWVDSAPVWAEMLVLWLGYVVWAAMPLLVLVFPAGRIGTVAALADLVLRWRRARGRERLQFRWLAYGTAVTVATLVVNTFEPLPDHEGWLGPLIIVWINAIPVAIATLAGAAAFLPALRWVQRRLDRRFHRERHDAGRVVDAFGGRLRTGADPASTAPELTAAIERTLQPAAVGLWMPGGAR